ncbi:unnamed protein product, partial [Amoebophrya sp. A25]
PGAKIGAAEYFIQGAYSPEDAGGSRSIFSDPSRVFSFFEFHESIFRFLPKNLQPFRRSQEAERSALAEIHRSIRRAHLHTAKPFAHPRNWTKQDVRLLVDELLAGPSFLQDKMQEPKETRETGLQKSSHETLIDSQWRCIFDAGVRSEENALLQLENEVLDTGVDPDTVLRSLQADGGQLLALVMDIYFRLFVPHILVVHSCSTSTAGATNTTGTTNSYSRVDVVEPDFTVSFCQDLLLQRLGAVKRYRRHQYAKMKATASSATPTTTSTSPSPSSQFSFVSLLTACNNNLDKLMSALRPGRPLSLTQEGWNSELEESAPWLFANPLFEDDANERSTRSPSGTSRKATRGHDGGNRARTTPNLPETDGKNGQQVEPVTGKELPATAFEALDHSQRVVERKMKNISGPILSCQMYRILYGQCEPSTVRVDCERPPQHL